MTGKTHVKPPDFKPGNTITLFCINDPRAGADRFAAVGSRKIPSRSRRAGMVETFNSGDRFARVRPESFDTFLDRHPVAPIKAVLLMQAGFPGIGNWMADEILWRAKVLPSKRVAKLKKNERAATFRETKFVVLRALATTGKDFSDPPKTWLIHQKWKRKGVCPIHRTLLKHATIGGRTTAWCATCQR